MDDDDAGTEALDHLHHVGGEEDRRAAFGEVPQDDADGADGDGIDAVERLIEELGVQQKSYCLNVIALLNRSRAKALASRIYSSDERALQLQGLGPEGHRSGATARA